MSSKSVSANPALGSGDESIKHVFLLGITGFIGGSLAASLLIAHPKWKYTALVRSEKDFPGVEAIGFKVLKGSFSDLDTICTESAASDVVVNAADADEVPVTKAIIEGLELRAAKSSSAIKPLLLHTSGTGVVADSATGEFNIGTSTKIWNDNVIEDIKSIAKEQPHRNVDLLIFAAHTKAAIEAKIVCPSCVYGRGTGPGKKISSQIPELVQKALAYKRARYRGKGTNLWNNVHVIDLMDLFLLVLASPAHKIAEANFYFGSVGEHVFGDVAKKIGDILYGKDGNLVSAPSAISVTPEEDPSLHWSANNSRSRSDRGFALGWKPQQAGLFETLKSDVEDVLQLSGI